MLYLQDIRRETDPIALAFVRGISRTHGISMVYSRNTIILLQWDVLWDH